MDKYDIDQILKAVGNNTGINTDTLLESLPKRIPTINTKTIISSLLPNDASTDNGLIDNGSITLSQSSPLNHEMKSSITQSIQPIQTTQPIIPIPPTESLKDTKEHVSIPEIKKKKSVKINSVPKYVSNKESDGGANIIINNNNNNSVEHKTINMIPIFGYNMPVTTLYFLIVMIIIGVVIFYFTGEKKKEDKKKKDDE